MKGSMREPELALLLRSWGLDSFSGVDEQVT